MKIYKWLIFVILFYFSIKSNAQQGHFVGLQSGMGIYLKSPNSYTFNQYSNDHYNFDVNYEYYGKNSLYMGARLSFSQAVIRYRGITHSENQYRFSKLNPDAGVGKVNFVNNFYSLPLFLGYSKMLNIIGFTGNFGLTPTLIQHTLSTNKNSMYSFDFGSHLEVGAFVMIKDKVKIAPSLNCYFNFSEKVNFSERLYQPFGLNMNFSYRLK